MTSKTLKQAPQRKIRYYFFSSPRTLGQLLFCLSGKQALKLQGLDGCLFRAIQKFGDKTHPPGPVKDGIIYCNEKITNED